MLNTNNRPNGVITSVFPLWHAKSTILLAPTPSVPRQDGRCRCNLCYFGCRATLCAPGYRESEEEASEEFSCGNAQHILLIHDLSSHFCHMGYQRGSSREPIRDNRVHDNWHYWSTFQHWISAFLILERKNIPLKLSTSQHTLKISS